jgi:V/A-type H+-transporting ATPase subunit A
MAVLQEEAELNEIVQLVGKDSLSPKDQITLEVAKMIREDFLQQNSFVDIDSFSEYDRQAKMMAMILHYDRLCRDAAAKGADVYALFDIPARVDIGRAKSVPADQYAEVYAKIERDMAEQIEAIAAKGGQD